MLQQFFNHLQRLIRDNGLRLAPIRQSLAGYDSSQCGADMRAGLNVALLAIPQGMAYAMLAGLPIYYGITCSAIAAIVAPILAGSRYVVLGPTNATAFLVLTAGIGLGYMPLLVLFVGLLLVVGAYLRVAELIQYISRSVVVGYITGAAILIIVNQMKHVLGIELTTEDGRTFLRVLYGLVTRLSEIQWPPLLIGCLTAGTYFGLRRVIRRLAFPVTLVGITLLCALLQWFLPTFVFADFGGKPFGVADLIPALPNFRDPQIFDQISYLFGVALGVAFLAALETSVMSKTLASRTGERVDLNQDMLSVGVANLGAAFLSGMPASGSLTRSALNYSSGARSGLSSIFSGLICLIGAVTLGSLVSFVPKACLAALVVCVAITLINRHSIRICLNATGSDAACLSSP